MAEPQGRPESRDRFIWNEGDLKFLDPETGEWVRLGEIPEEHSGKPAADKEFSEKDHPRDKGGQFATKGEVASSVHKSLVSKGFNPVEGEQAHYQHSSGHSISFEPKDAKSSFAYGWQHRDTEGNLIKKDYGESTLARQLGKIQRGETGSTEKPQKKNVIPTSDNEVTQEIINQLPSQARTPEGAERYFENQLRSLAAAGQLRFYHEIPGNLEKEVKRSGIEGEFAVFAAVNAPSEFVSGEKTEVQFEVPARELSGVLPDVIYSDLEKLSSHQMLLLKHPDLKGAYVAVSSENIPPNQIKSVKVLKPSAQDKEFSEKDHPRGQPENAGEFAPKGSGGGGSTAKGSTQKGSSESGGGEAPKGSAQAHLVSLEKDKWPEHIQALKLPPAWRDVKVSPDPKAALQAIGKDAKGRPQYVYSAAFSQSQTAKKFARIKKLDARFDKMMKQNDANLKSRDERTKQHAQVAALILDMGLRPGSERDTGAKEKAYGATTLEATHVIAKGDETRLQFTGKKGVKIDLPVDNPALAKTLREKARGGGQLFPRVSADSLGGYIKQLGGDEFKTKDLRTLKASRMANDLVSAAPVPTNETQYKKAVRIVAQAVSAKLGNTPTVALQSYINPVVFAPWQGALSKVA